jgi:hypothetical protein
MSIHDQGVQELSDHIEKFFSDKIGAVTEKDLAVIAAADYCKRYCVPGSSWQDRFDNLTILHVASLYARTDS